MEDGPDRGLGVAQPVAQAIDRRTLGALRPDRRLSDLDPQVLASVVARFWTKVEKLLGGCWRWNGHVAGHGYGYVNVARGILMRAHRFAYELENGPIARGLVVDHLCRNRLCVNPAHLEAITNRENVLRGQQPQMVAARSNTCKRGHSLLDARVTPKGRTCRVCNRLREAEKRAARKAVSA